MGDSMEYREYEDITSSSKKEEFVDLSSMSSNYRSKHYKKKKHGIAGFFQNIGSKFSKWWKKAGKLQKASIISVTSLVAVVLAAVIFVTTYFDYNYNNITGDADNLGFEEVIDKKVINIALFGIDSRSKNFKGNSDSIMVLSLNTEAKQIKIVSIMRDSLVKIEYKGKTSYKKINSAYATGGPELAIKTINENFGLDISEYATVNFEGMKDIIDAVGGIDAELTSKEVAPIDKAQYLLNGNIFDICRNLGIDPQKYYITKPGVQHLNGIQAVAYSRIRKTANIWGTNNDHGRTDRQRYVMEQLFNKAITLKKSDYIKLAKALIPCTETSLSYTQIIGLASDILLKSPTFSQSRVPMEEYQITKGVPNISGVGSIVYYDLDYATKLLHSYFYDDVTPEEYIKLNGIEKNNWYKGNQSSSGSRPNPNQTSNPSSSSSGTSSVVSSETSSTTSSEVESSKEESSSEVVSSEPKEESDEAESSSESQSSSSQEASSSDAASTESKDTTTGTVSDNEE